MLGKIRDLDPFANASLLPASGISHRKPSLVKTWRKRDRIGVGDVAMVVASGLNRWCCGHKAFEKNGRRLTAIIIKGTRYIDQRLDLFALRRKSHKLTRNLNGG